MSIEIDTQQARTGSPVNLSAIRSDILEIQGGDFASCKLECATGSLSAQGETVIWTPSKIGNWTIGVNDQGFSATLEVNVIQGEIIGIEILLSEEKVRSGDLVVASVSAYDSAGNHRLVDGAWTIDSALNSANKGSWYELRPGPIGNHTISATWFDNETSQVHEIEHIVHVEQGELARIILPESGTRVPSDGVLDLNPRFEDEYGNLVDDVLVTWIVDSVDTTMEIRLAGNKWAPSKLGMHEIKATSQGVFAITDVEVIAGTPRLISTNYDQGIEVNSGEEFEITVSTRDVHGNIALATDIQFEYEDPLGMIKASTKGDGYWIIEGGEMGEWNLRLSAGSANIDIPVTVSSGDAVRLLAEIPEQNPEEGSKMIMRIHAIDQAGNRIEVPHQEVTIKCTTGDAEHLAGDTYEVSIDQAGQSQSCNVLWNDLVAQRFFDVDAVLFGGGLGDSNTALSMVSFIVLLFIAIMFVLIRRIKNNGSEVFDWEEEFADDEEETSIDDSIESEERYPEPASESVTTEQKTTESGEDLRAN